MPPRSDEYETQLIAKKALINQEATTSTATSRVTGNNLLDSSNKKTHEIHLPIVWKNVAIFTLLHLGALYGVYLCFFAKKVTLLFGMSYVLGFDFVCIFTKILINLSVHFICMWRTWYNCWLSQTLGAPNLQS
jgi:hypothetical protein